MRFSRAMYTFKMQSDIGDKKEEEPFTSIIKPTESRILLRKLYPAVHYELGSFYQICSIRKDIGKQVQELEIIQSRLLNNLREFLMTDWKQIFRKGRLINQCKKDMADILEKTSQYLSEQNRLKRERHNLKEFVVKQSKIFSKLISTVDLEFYTEPYYFLDTDCVVKIIDHVRSEIETYSLNTSTFFSALLGAIVGSIITLVVSLSL